MTGVRTAILGASLLAAAAPLLAQRPATPQTPPATGVIIGRVVDGSSGNPIREAVVTVTGRGLATPPVLPSPTGAFVFESLPAGPLTLLAARAGYTGGAYGQLHITSSGQRLELRPGERLTGVELRLWKFAAISGTVVDEIGDPVVSLPVFAYPLTLVAGRRVLNGVTPLQARTDDRGVFRIARLLPGSYVVALAISENAVPLSMVEGYHDASFSENARSAALSRGLTEAGMDGDLPGSSYLLIIDGQLRSYWNNTAVPPAPLADGTVLAYQTTFYPGAADADAAQPIALASGEERTGVDFQLRLVPTVKVSGRVTGPAGPLANVAVRLVPPTNQTVTAELPVARALSDATGAFMFLAVPPGRYDLRVLTMPSENSSYLDAATGLATSPRAAGGGDEPSWWASVPVTVGDSHVRDVSVVLQRGARVSGRVDISGLTTTRLTGEQLERIVIRFERADGRAELSQAVARPDAQGRFRTPELSPGRYVVRVATAPTAWSAMFDGREVSISPIEVAGRDVDGLVIALTDRTTEITGVVRQNGVGDTGAIVIAFPTDRDTWMDYGRGPRHLQRVRAGRDGTFSIGGLPPRAYYVVAVADDGSADWQDPKFLERIAGMATTVRAIAGEKVSCDLSTSQVR